MLKFSKYNLLGISAIVLLFSACSSKEVTIGNKMMTEATALDNEDLLKKELAKDWNEGSKLIEKGNKSIEEGKELIEDAKDLEDEAVDLKKEAIDLEKEAKDLKTEEKTLFTMVKKI